MTVKISPSVEGAPFGCNVIDAETALFIVIEISALPRKNLSSVSEREGCDGWDEGYRLKGFRLKAGIRNSKHLSLQPIYLGSYLQLMKYRQSLTGRKMLERLE